MPKIQIPSALLKKEKRVQRDEFLKKNNVCTFEQFLKAVGTGKVNHVQELNYLDSYINDKKYFEPQVEIAALLLAIRLKHIEMVKFLLAEGADPNTKDGFGFTVLHIAVRDCYTELVQLLLNNGANTEARDRGGFTPLHIAAFNGSGHVQVAELLLDNKANLLAKTESETLLGYDGCSALHVAAEHDFVSSGQREMIAFLLSRKLDLEVKNNIGCTPLHWVAIKGATEGVKILLDNGADLETKVESEGSTALHLAVVNNHPETVELLLERGANIAAIAKDGSTPLSVAYKNGHRGVVEVLLRRDAKLEQKISPHMENTKPKADNKNFEIKKGFLNKDAKPIKSEQQITNRASQSNDPIKSIPGLSTFTKESIRQVLNNIVPNKPWKISSLKQAWLQLDNQQEANSILNHFKKNGYQAIQLSYRKDSPNTPIIIIEIDNSQLNNIPTLEIFQQAKLKTVLLTKSENTYLSSKEPIAQSLIQGKLTLHSAIQGFLKRKRYIPLLQEQRMKVRAEEKFPAAIAKLAQAYKFAEITQLTQAMQNRNWQEALQIMQANVENELAQNVANTLA